MIFTTQLDAVTYVMAIQFACRSLIILNSNSFDQKYILVLDLIRRSYSENSIAVLLAQGSGIPSVLGMNMSNYTLTGFAAGQWNDKSVVKSHRSVIIAEDSHSITRQAINIETYHDHKFTYSTDNQTVIICISLTPTGSSNSPSKVIMIKNTPQNSPAYTTLESIEYPSIISCMYIYNANYPKFLLLCKSGSMIIYCPTTKTAKYHSIATKSNIC